MRRYVGLDAADTGQLGGRGDQSDGQRGFDVVEAGVAVGDAVCSEEGKYGAGVVGVDRERVALAWRRGRRGGVERDGAAASGVRLGVVGRVAGGGEGGLVLGDEVGEGVVERGEGRDRLVGWGGIGRRRGLGGGRERMQAE